jgi:hypothetical protein
MQIGATYCWLTASAGAKVTFDVIVFPPLAASLGVTLEPAEPRPGQPFRIAATANVGQYGIFNADIAVRMIQGTTSASLSASSVNTSFGGAGWFTVTPDARLGDYQIELKYRDKTLLIPVRAPANPWQDLWWSGIGENGWGMSVVQHRDVLFSIIYAYDNAGKAVWYVMTNGEWNAAHTAFSGLVYVPKGSPLAAYDASRFDIGAPVGSLTLTFNNQANDATLDYTINGVTGHKAISRILYGEGGTSPTRNVGDLWWGGVSQNGWGIAVLQSGVSLFNLWFTYDEAGNATWYAMPSGYWRDAKTYSGGIYRTTGTSWVGRPYDLSAFHITEAGGYTLHFNDDGTASFQYSFTDGRTGTLPLTRIPF